MKTFISWLLVAYISLACSAHTLAEATLVSENQGAQLYMHWCIHCHSPAPFAAGTSRLKFARPGVSPVLMERDDLDAQYVSTVVRNGLGAMPSFRRTEITEQELAAITRFLTNQ